MKRFLCIVSALILCLLAAGFASCKAKTPGNDGTSAVTGNVSDDGTPAVPGTDPVTKPAPESYSWTAEEKTVKIGSSGVSSYTLRYPEIAFSGQTDPAAINNTVYRSAEQRFRLDIPNATALASSGAEIQYEITGFQVLAARENLFSVIFTVSSRVYGDSSSERGTSEYCWTLNANPQTGETYAFTEFCTSLTALKTALTEGRFTDENGNPDGLSAAERQNVLLQYREDYGIYPDLAFSGEGVYVVCGLTDINRQYFCYFIPLESAKEFFQLTGVLSGLYSNGD